MSDDYNVKAKDSIALMVIIVAVIVIVLWKFPELYQGPWWIIKRIEVEIIIFARSLMPQDVVTGAYKIRDLLIEVPIGEFKFKGMVNSDNFTLPYVGWIFNLIIVVMGFTAIRKDVLKIHNKRHDIESILEETSKVWRFNRYLIKHNPLDDLKLIANNQSSNFRFRDKPIEYLKRKEIITLNGSKYELSHIKLLDDSIFVLGEQYTGLNCLNRDELVLMAGLSLIVTSKPFYRGFKGVFYNSPLSKFLKIKGSLKAMDVAVGLFGDMSECYNDERSFDEVEDYARAILDETLINPKVAEIVSQHAYKSTLLRRMLIEARSSYGVISPAIFGWIAINNRVLFVSLSDEGMAESSVEAYAIANHLKYELLLKRAVFEIDIERFEVWISHYLKNRGIVRG